MSTAEMDGDAASELVCDCDISVLGLGAMGARMASALIAQGKRVAIWNRSRAKTESRELAGATRCETAEAAILASPVSILVFLDNAALHEVFRTVDQSRVFQDREIVNFTTNSLDESRALQELVGEGGGHFLKGTIVAYPRNIGHPETFAIYSGASDIYARCASLLEFIAPNAIVLPLEEAYALSATLHSFAFAAMAAFYEAIAAHRHLGLPPAKAAHLVCDATRFFVTDAMQDAAKRLQSGNFDGNQARIDVHASAFEYLAASMHSRGATIPIFDAVCQITKRAQAIGLGDQDIAALITAFAPETIPVSPLP